VNAEAPATIAVSVAWSPAARAMQQAALRLPAGATVADALAATGWTLPEGGWTAAVGSRTRDLAHALRDGDRVEVLRDLQVDPMVARRARFDAAGGIDALRQRGYGGRKLK
jgi:putative ubiquitin-RnfH superfamily antitoxin RatB of RatAB toxin-antitoxin module